MQGDSKSAVIKSIFKDIALLNVAIDEAKDISLNLSSDVESKGEEAVDDYINCTRNIIDALKDSIDHIKKTFEDLTAGPTTNGISSESGIKLESGIGKIKLVDLSKLIDPSRTKALSKPLDEEKDDSIVILSDSGSDSLSVAWESILKRKTRRNNNNNPTKQRDGKRANRSILKSSQNGLNMSVLNSTEELNESGPDKVATPKKVQFADPSDTTILSKITDLLNDSPDSSEATEDNDGQRQKDKRIKKSTRDRDCCEIADDPKLSWRCCVDLKRVPAEKLLKSYRQKVEDSEFKRLASLKNLKRARQARNGSSSDSNDSPKQVKKKLHRKGAIERTPAVISSSDTDDGKAGKHVTEDKCDELLEDTVEPIDDANVEVQQQDFILDTIQPDGESGKATQEEAVGPPKFTEDAESDQSKKNGDDARESSMVEEKMDNVNGEEDHSDETTTKRHGEKHSKEKSTEKNSDDSSDETSTKKKNEKKDKKSEAKSSDEDTSGKENRKKSKEAAAWKRDRLLAKATDTSDSDGTALDKFKKKCQKKASERRSMRKKPIRVISDSDESSKEKARSSESEEYEEENKESSDSDDSDSDAKSKREESKSRRRIKRVKQSSSDDDADKSTRKNIRKVLHNDSLSESTVQAEKNEKERKARILERQKRYNNIFEEDKLEKSSLTKVVLDFNEETTEELLVVDQEIVKHLKPHQGKGVQFMWDASFESIDRAKGTAGSGCILAHCMGLGKTLQVITLVHTLLKNTEKTGVNKVLIVCPLSTVLNWVAEFTKWLPDDDVVQVFDLVAFKQNKERMYQTMEWHKHGGVLILGYDMFRNLSNEKNKRMSKKLHAEFDKALVNPGPDLVVCDEGHLLKNEKTSLSICMNRLKTARRIVLTGTPLQNNMKEYFCMVQFVKPSLLGTYKEYLNRFVNPITNGQYTDSTQHDIQIMRKRSHVLHKLLDGIVQRRDYSVLAPYLPPKYEYVVFVQLTETQNKLYAHYLKHFARMPTVGGGKSFLFVDSQEFQRICTHPRVLLDKSIQNKIAQDKKDWEDDDESEGSLKDFLDDESEAASTSDNSSSGSEEKSKKEAPASKPKRRTRAMAEKEGSDKEEEVAEVQAAPSEWWRQYTQGDELDNIMHSGKLHLLFEILHQCELMGDKILVFSQSLYSLNVIEYFLSKIDEAGQNDDAALVGGYKSSWALGLDYYRLDGSSSCDNRASWCKSFNDPENIRARLFLISTRAGGLGINLVAANRVIIFDVSWNPSHDIQSIYRVYRFGQNKPTYVYRFVTYGTMEMKIYERQVIKQSISKRVIDEQQIDRHYNQSDLMELYKFEQPEARPIPLVPKDMLLGELLQNYENLIYKYHEHQSLLENKEDEVLDEEERKAAWEEFENEKKARHFSANTGSLSKGFGLGGINQLPMTTIINALSSIIRREHPTFTAAEINGVMPQLIQELHGQIAAGETTMYQKILFELSVMQSQHNQKVQELYQLQQQQQALSMYERLQQQKLSGNMRINPAARMGPYTQRPQIPMNAPSNSRVNAPVDPKEVVQIDD